MALCNRAAQSKKKALVFKFAHFWVNNGLVLDPTDSKTRALLV